MRERERERMTEDQGGRERGTKREMERKKRDRGPGRE